MAKKIKQVLNLGPKENYHAGFTEEKNYGVQARIKL